MRVLHVQGGVVCAPTNTHAPSLEHLADHHTILNKMVVDRTLGKLPVDGSVMFKMCWNLQLEGFCGVFPEI